MKYATYDELTGLFEQKGWMVNDRNTYGKSKGGNSDFSICFIDIDGLKYINDKYGHDEADCYIKTVASMLASSVRNNDCIFRYGGDEIIIIFDNSNMLQAEEIMKRVEAILNETQYTQNKPYPLRISYGIVNFNDYDADTLEDYIRHADHLMYENKKSKKKTS